jgi:hypothetical protein
LGNWVRKNKQPVERSNSGERPVAAGNVRQKPRLQLFAAAGSFCIQNQTAKDVSVVGTMNKKEKGAKRY